MQLTNRRRARKTQQDGGQFEGPVRVPQCFSCSGDGGEKDERGTEPRPGWRPAGPARAGREGRACDRGIGAEEGAAEGLGGPESRHWTSELEGRAWWSHMAADART